MKMLLQLTLCNLSKSTFQLNDVSNNCSILIYVVLISVTDGLNCIVCSSATNVNCDDPFRGDTSTSSSLSQGGFTSCLVSDRLYRIFCRFLFRLIVIRKRHTGQVGNHIREVLSSVKVHRAVVIHHQVLEMLRYFIVVQTRTTATVQQLIPA